MLQHLGQDDDVEILQLHLFQRDVFELQVRESVAALGDLDRRPVGIDGFYPVAETRNGDRDIPVSAADLEDVFRSLSARLDHTDDAGEAVPVAGALVECRVLKIRRSPHGSVFKGFRPDHEHETQSFMRLGNSFFETIRSRRRTVNPLRLPGSE